MVCAVLLFRKYVPIFPPERLIALYFFLDTRFDWGVDRSLQAGEFAHSVFWGNRPEWEDEMQDQDWTERRGARRARVNLNATERRGEESFVHPVVYLSATGMLLRDASFTLERFLDVEDVALDFCLPGSTRIFSVRGRIVRLEPTDEGEPGVGIEFIGLDARDSEAIDAYVRGVLDGHTAARNEMEHP